MEKVVYGGRSELVNAVMMTDLFSLSERVTRLKLFGDMGCQLQFGWYGWKETKNGLELEEL